MMHESPRDEVRVLLAYSDPDRHRQCEPALVVFCVDGRISAGILIDHPCAEERDGTHGPPAEHVERMRYRVSFLQDRNASDEYLRRN